MDLSTNYLGLELAHPLMPGASPLVDDLDQVRRLEDAGASAIVMHSLFEEQIAAEQLGSQLHLEAYESSHAEASGYFPRLGHFALAPEEYLEQIRRIRATVEVPVIASLNGSTPGWWLTYAQLMEEAGASALELNLYEIASDVEVSSSDIEARELEVLRQVRARVRVPIAIKLSPFYTSLPAFARQLARAGANGLVLFNRFAQAEIDEEALEVRRSMRLSEPSELALRLRWIALLSGRAGLSLAASGGVHTGRDAVRAIMAGADAVQLVSVLLRLGPRYLRTVIDELAAWMREHEYESMAQLRGCMDLRRCPDPRAFERAHYVHGLQSWIPRD